MAKRRYGEKQNSIIFRWLYFVLFTIIAVWLISSIIIKKSPAETIKSVFTKLPTTAIAATDSLMVQQKDSIISSLELQLAQCRGEASYSRAMVLIESQTLNLREKPSLSSRILLKIPANSEVELLYYDTKTYYLQGEPGKWCKIRYADTEGWAWGNYIKEI